MDHSEYLKVAGPYFHLFKKACYGVDYIKRNNPQDTEFAMKFTNILRNLSNAYSNLIVYRSNSGLSRIISVENFCTENFTIAKGILYGDISKARIFSESYINNTDSNSIMLDYALYISYCVEKETRDFIPIPENLVVSSVSRNSASNSISSETELSDELNATQDVVAGGSGGTDKNDSPAGSTDLFSMFSASMFNFSSTK